MIAFVSEPLWLRSWARDRFTNLLYTTRCSITFILLCLVLFAVSGCNSVKQRRVDDKANEISQNMFTPTDAVLLGKVENDHLLAYARGCTGTVIEIAYGVNRPLIEIIEEYHRSLLETGWELHPGYKPNKNDTAAVFRKGAQVNVWILAQPVNVVLPTPKPNEQTFITTYAVMIIYSKPSNADCIG